jgi:glutamyl/glutaminyl-tRNA synthetase
VVDDALMDITHVIRGDDHISNTPKQIAIYEALGFKVPKFAHIPLIMGSDNARLSKRHGATSVSHYRDLGYLPEAFVNFLALLGWSAGDNKELMSLEELQKKFSLKRVTGKSAIFDHDKRLFQNKENYRELLLK